MSLGKQTGIIHEKHTAGAEISYCALQPITEGFSQCKGNYWEGMESRLGKIEIDSKLLGSNFNNPGKE